MEGHAVYNLPSSPPIWDRLGVFYLSFCIIWTILLISGMTFCWLNRDVPLIRVRGIFWSFLAIGLLHVYWILGQITYPIVPTMPGLLSVDIQYFAMGIYFPLGIALFQASNLRFLHVARMQRQFVYPELRSSIDMGYKPRPSSIMGRLRGMTYMSRTTILIAIGILLQLIITIGMWLACSKYHPTYGIPGTGVRGDTLSEQMAYMRRGWEWWPSLLWQVIWTWIAAPILIFRAWRIRDTMGWRTQTIACCVASLHATPMFLAASYAPAFEKVNIYFVPSQWIHVSIFLWEIFTVFVPIFQVFQLRAMKRKTIDSTAKYDACSFSTISKSPPPSPMSPSIDWKSSTSTLAEKGQSHQSLKECYSDRLYTMDALDHVLHKGSEQLQEFAALNDFSGENIAFLGELESWKKSWPPNLSDDQVPNAFNQALRIYATFVSIQDAEFPLNISSHHLKRLQDYFERPTRLIFGDRNVNSTSPFMTNEAAPQLRAGESDTTLNTIHSSSIPTYTGDIPPGFDMSIFDEIQDHIKWLVLTNTWPKYIDAMRRQSTDTDRSYQSNSTETTFTASRILDNRFASRLSALF